MRKKAFLLIVLGIILAFTSCEKSDSKDEQSPDMSINLQQGLVLNYTFDEGPRTTDVKSVVDYSRSGVHGVVEGNADNLTDTPNGKGYAIRLNKDDYINIPQYVLQGCQDLSMNIWIKDYTQGWLLASIKPGVVTPSLGINNSDKIVYNGRTNYIFAPNVSIYRSNGWHMISLTSEYVGATQGGAQGALEGKSIISLYIDGLLMDSQRVWQDVCSGTSMRIAPEAEPMSVDNVRIYSRSLNSEEVRELYYTERR